MSINYIRILSIQLFIFILLSPVYAQNQAKHEHAMEMQAGEGDSVMRGLYGHYTMSRESSGTSWQPDSTPMEGIHFMQKDWMLMMQGFINGIYDQQNGKRGDEKFFSTSMFMFMARKELDNGVFGFRSMLSLDPLMGRSGYPLLLQTGETADGQVSLLDRQHPHDLFMELAVTYSIPVSESSSLYAYFGLPGEPALGPPAFMHRFSGMDLPAAPIMHHWLDSSHITYGVLTLGHIWDQMKIEGSIFNGREPDQDRWDIESPKFDSASGRVSFNPTENWALQSSFGYIDSPEQLEPNIDTRRLTASIIYNRPIKQGNWQTTFSWGRNDNIGGNILEGFLLESALRLNYGHTFMARFERVEKDELFPEANPLYSKAYVVNKLTVGYIYDFINYKKAKGGIGFSFDINMVPNGLKSYYGKLPTGYMVFLRMKL